VKGHGLAAGVVGLDLLYMQHLHTLVDTVGAAVGQGQVVLHLVPLYRVEPGLGVLAVHQHINAHHDWVALVYLSMLVSWVPC
jgi:hypothetical protein